MSRGATRRDSGRRHGELAARLDAAASGVSRTFRWSIEEQEAERVRLLAGQFAKHYADNAYYRGLVEAAGPRPTIGSISDLTEIPLLPVNGFKQPDASHLLSVPLEDIELELLTTGTSGVPSLARRDTISTSRVYSAVITLYREFFGIGGGVVAILTPPGSTHHSLGMVKALNLVSSLADDRQFFVGEDYSFEASRVVEYLRSWQDQHTRHLFGPPFLIQRLVSYLRTRNEVLPLDPESFVVSIGGWKRFTGDQIPRPEYDRGVSSRLGIDVAQVRDMYGLTEANILAIECRYHRKHVPPYCHVGARHLDDPALEVEPGSPGVAAILDPLGNSYPAFLLTEDVVTLETLECPCGRNGQVLEFVDRVGGAELGCCAVRIDSFMSEKP